MKLTRYITFILLAAISSTTALAVDTLYDNRFKQWLAKAETGDSFSQYSLGNAYLRGNEVSIDKSRAVHWFKEAASQGHAKSQYKLGYLYYTGKGVKRSYRNAFKWFQLAANSDYSPAQFYIGKMYADGKGTSVDNRQALGWFNKALSNNYTPAAKEIRRVENRMQTANQERQKSRIYSTPVKTVVSEPVKKIVVAKRTKPQKTVVKKKKTSKKRKAKRKGRKKTSVADLLGQGNWIYKDKPTEILPSALNECNATSDRLYCKTDEILETTDYADINYKIESIFGRFNDKKGSFTVKNKKRILFVLPLDANDPDVDPKNIPTAGTETEVMKCAFESSKKIRCATSDSKKIYFTRK